MKNKCQHLELFHFWSTRKKNLSSERNLYFLSKTNPEVDLKLSNLPNVLGKNSYCCKAFNYRGREWWGLGRPWMPPLSPRDRRQTNGKTGGHLWQTHLFHSHHRAPPDEEKLQGRVWCRNTSVGLRCLLLLSCDLDADERKNNIWPTDGAR